MTTVQKKALVIAALAMVDTVLRQYGDVTELDESAGYRDAARKPMPEVLRLRAARARLLSDNPWLVREGYA